MNKVPFTMVTRGASSRPVVPKLPDKTVQVLVHQLSPNTLRLYGEDAASLVTSETVQASAAPSTSGNSTHTIKSKNSPTNQRMLGAVKNKIGKKSCTKCLIHQRYINRLRKIIQDQKRKEKDLEKKLEIYEGLVVSHLEKEKEYQNMLKKKSELQIKLSSLKDKEATVPSSTSEEEIILLDKRSKLREEVKKRKLEHEEATEKERNKIEQHIQRKINMQNKVPELQDEVIKLTEEYSKLQEKLEEERKLFSSRPKVEEEKIQETCQTCIDLVAQGKKEKKDCSILSKSYNDLRSEIFKIHAKVYESDKDNQNLQFEVDYLKKRILNQRRYQSPEDDDDISFAVECDDEERFRFKVKVIELMEKTGFCYPMTPQTSGLPLQKGETARAEGGGNYCCKHAPKWCKKYFCGKSRPEVDFGTNNNLTDVKKMNLRDYAVQYLEAPMFWNAEYDKEANDKMEKWRDAGMLLMDTSE